MESSIVIKKKQILIHFLVWVFLYFFIIIQMPWRGTDLSIEFLYRTSVQLFFFYVNYSLLVPYLLLKEKKGLYFVFGFACLFLVWIIFKSSFFMQDFNFQRANYLGEFAFRKRRIVPMPVVFTITLFILGAAVRVYEEWNRNERNNEKIEAQKNLSELKVLKNQLNPHFLFNSLNSIYSLAAKKSNEAPEAIITLSELMRYMLYQANDDFVLLKNELAYIENYIKLQQLRIYNSENVKINIRGNVSTQQIRPLLFISYIENAFKYGTDFSGNTEVKININIVENELHFKCVNLIGGELKIRGDSGIGMKNTLERLELLYPEKFQLKIDVINEKFVIDLKLILD